MSALNAAANNKQSESTTTDNEYIEASSLKLCASMVNIKSTSNAIWWIKNPKAATGAKAAATAAAAGGARKKSLGSSFCRDMADLLRNISLQGYNKLLAPELTLWERLIWLLVHTTTFITLVTVLSLTWEQFVAQYFVTNLKDPLYPIENVPFPAVSICSNNRISKQAVIKYAHELQSRDTAKHGLNYYVENLKSFGSFYGFADANFDPEDYADFQSFLDIYSTFDNETFFNTRRIMTSLSPSCENFILKCTLANVDIPCFSNTAFQSTLTVYGLCCTFNSLNTLKSRNFKNRLANMELGLTVVLNASKADNFAPILNTNGYIVIIHNADSYASVTASGALEMNPGHNEEAFIEIYPRVVDTDDTLQSFSPFSRRCYFQDESPFPEEMLRSTYTFSNCITRCRMRSIIALCRCLPFYMPLELLQNREGVVYCTLAHMSCIKQYLFKWRNVLTDRNMVPSGLEREVEEAVYCPECLPACKDVQYSVFVSTLPLDNFLASNNNSNNNLGDDLSVLRVYFGEQNAHLYIRLLNNAWFEVFSTVGNILSIFMGFSLVAIFETLFFLVKYIYVGCHRIVEQGSIEKQAKEAREVAKLHIYP